MMLPTTARPLAYDDQHVEAGDSKCGAKVTRMVRHAVFTTVTTRDASNKPIREKVSIGGRAKVTASEVSWSVDVAGHDTTTINATVCVQDGSLSVKLVLPAWAKRCVELT